MIEEDLKAKALKVEDDHRKGVKKRDDYTENMELYFEYKSKGICESVTHSYAFRLQEDEIKREIIESLLLADADLEKIEQFFGITPEIIEIYQELFFDKAAFYTKLDKISYITNYKAEVGKELKVRALNLGPEFIFFKYANLVPKTEEQRKIVKLMFMTSAYKVMEANYNSMNSSMSKAAQTWGATMMKSYEAIEKLMVEDTDDANDLVKLITRRDIKLADETPEDGEIL